jgi:hypothetical protein
MPLWVASGQQRQNLVIGEHSQATDSFDAIWDRPMPPALPQMESVSPFAAFVGVDDRFTLQQEVRKAGSDEEIWHLNTNLPQEGILTWDATMLPKHSTVLIKMDDVTINCRHQTEFVLPTGEHNLTLRFIRHTESAKTIPSKFYLAGNYPNPCNPETWIAYHLPKAADVRIIIYNSLGQQVRMLELGNKPAGKYDTRHTAAHWNGRNTQGEQVASGVYFYVLSAGSYKAVKRMAVVR